MARPWLSDYEVLLEHLGVSGERTQRRVDGSACRDAANRWLESRARQERMVLPSSTRTSAEDYERRIVVHQEIETRDNLHDSMNTLMWLSWPRAKRAISVLHVEELSRQVDPSRRGRRRDAATLFDEHGVILLTRRMDLIELLRGHDWSKAWLQQRQAFIDSTRVMVFGHALLEKLFEPHKGLGAHALVIACSGPWPTNETIDEILAGRIAALADPAGLLALPVMGLPGFSDAQDQGFYADTNVFRPA